MRAVADWLAAARLIDGPLFSPINRHGNQRSGLATAAAQAGVSERTIMEQSGHKSLPIVRRYIRRGSLFTDNAAAKVGL